MAFKDLKDQERTVDFFRNCVNAKKLAHAYLFLGPQQADQLAFSKNLAKFLNCENPRKEGKNLLDCCDQCPSCRKIDALNHPDIHWLGIKHLKKISIDQMRQLQKEISLKAYEGKFKVFIIEDAPAMTEEAANSLLKTLEEPPDFSLIILIAPDLSGLLPTIISRSQIIKFYPSPKEATVKGKDIIDKRNRIVERLSEVNRGCLANELFNIKDKQELNNEIEYLLFWFRDLLFFRLGCLKPSLINQDKFKAIQEQALDYRIEDLEQIITQIDDTHRLLEQNVSPRLTLEVMLRRIAKCRK